MLVQNNICESEVSLFMVEAIKTQSSVKPESISVNQLRNTLFEIMVCENVEEDATSENTFFTYDMRLDRANASSYKELLIAIVQMKYDCDANFDFENPVTAAEYQSFKDFFEKAKAICSKYFTSDESDYKVRVCLTDEIALSDMYDITKMSLEDAKAYCVVLTNSNLELFLQKNPLYSDVHGGVMKPYNVTTSKQNQMGTVVMLYNAAEMLQREYPVRWNASGEECEEWAIEELLTLAFQISDYVEPFVAEQRKKERMVLAAESIDDLLKISYTY